MDYARALLTKNMDNNTSIIYLKEENWRIVDPSGQLLDWASQCLWTVVKPQNDVAPNTKDDAEKPEPMTDQPEAQTPPPGTSKVTPKLNETVTMMAECLQSLITLTKQQAAEKEAAAERAKEKERAANDKSVNTITDSLLTPLLGFSGLAWDERESCTQSLQSCTQPKIARNEMPFSGLSSMALQRRNHLLLDLQTHGCLRILVYLTLYQA